MKRGLDVDIYRWYEILVLVVEIYGKFFGIRYIINLYFESLLCEDCCVIIEFFEMEEVVIKLYKEKNKMDNKIVE